MPKEENIPKTPDFDELNDRLIAEAPAGPIIGIRTNLDPENPEEYSLYKEKRKK